MPSEANPTPSTHTATEWRFVVLFAAAVGILLALPAAHALLSMPPGARYLGYQYNVDDHMVYAAWMRQAMEGRFFFENRFTTDAQPGLTVHLYFWLLGQLAHLTGIVGATHITRIGFGVLFVFLLARLLRQMGVNEYGRKLGLILGVFGAGIGALIWHDFGLAIIKPDAPTLGGLTGGLLPIDVWQPEAVVFPSVLTSSLFAVSLCLMLGVVLAVLQARESWKPVLPGALMFGFLMNIHSYDVLILALALVGFLVMTRVQKTATREWIIRALVIAAGALPAAAYFVIVISQDPVFRNRAGVETLSPNFRLVLFGLLFVMLPTFLALWPAKDSPAAPRQRQGVAALAVGLVVLFGISMNHSAGMLMNLPGWLAALGLGLGVCVLLRTECHARNLLIAWAVLGLVALYFPAAFQRKLGMAMAVPWAMLAAIGLASVLDRQERNLRNLSTALILILASWSSLRWLIREVRLIDLNVANTTVHSVYLSPDMGRIIDELGKLPGRKVTIAPPGVPNAPVREGTQDQEPDSFVTPFVTDLNPILTAFAGATTYAGHWGETPNYGQRRTEVQRVYLSITTPEERAALLEKIRPEFIVAPVASAFPGGQFADLSTLGEVIFSGDQFVLIRFSTP